MILYRHDKRHGKNKKVAYQIKSKIKAKKSIKKV